MEFRRVLFRSLRRPSRNIHWLALSRARSRARFCPGASGPPFDAGRRARTAFVTASAAESRRPYSTPNRSEEHTSELQSLMRISYAVFCLKKKKYSTQDYTTQHLTHITKYTPPHQLYIARQPN